MRGGIALADPLVGRVGRGGTFFNRPTFSGHQGAVRGGTGRDAPPIGASHRPIPLGDPVRIVPNTSLFSSFQNRMTFDGSPRRRTVKPAVSFRRSAPASRRTIRRYSRRDNSSYRGQFSQPSFSKDFPCLTRCLSTFSRTTRLEPVAARPRRSRCSGPLRISRRSR